MIPRLEKSICGCSLYTGSLILGWVYTLASLAAVIVNVFMGRFFMKELEMQLKHDDPAKEEHVALYVETAYGIALGFCVIGLLINSLLLYGVYKRNFCLMMPHLIAYGALICLYILVTFLSFFMAFTSLEMFSQFLTIFIFTAVLVYFWVLLFSFYKHLKDESTMNQNAFSKM